MEKVLSVCDLDLPRYKALEKAIALAGGMLKLANLINVNGDKIYEWLNVDRKVPVAYAHRIELALDKKISRYRLCPDLKKAKLSC